MSLKKSPVTSGEPPAASGEPPAARHLTDAMTMRALAHPVRLALLDALGRHDQLTATQAGEVIGESPTTCSFHLRMLAKYGFVEEAGDAPGRRRPWRRKSASAVIFPAVHDDPETSLAAAALSDLVWGRMLDRTRTALASRPHMSAQWQAITSAAETVAYVTQDEAKQFEAELWKLIARYQDRAEDPSRRPAGSLPLEVLLFTYPLDAVPPGG
jgi:DNA-binding transcriptional ArsR family regulator